MFGFQRGELRQTRKLSLIWAQKKEQLAFVLIALVFGTVLYLTILQ
jgi:hypothetical protein